MTERKFAEELEKLINKYSVENESDTPDFILASYLCRCLDAFNYTMQQRDKWWGDDHWDNLNGNWKDLDENKDEN